MLVDEVMRAAAAVRHIDEGTTAGRDGTRRHARLCELTHISQVRHHVSATGLISYTKGTPIEDVREQLLLYECPEDLRLAVVAEFIEAKRRTPQLEAEDVAERRTATYCNSAPWRKQLSTASGPQLTPEDVVAWDSLWAALLPAPAPSWVEDPVFMRACAYYAEQGHHNAQKHNKKMIAAKTDADRGGDSLARDLEIVRRARLQDVWAYPRSSHHRANSQPTLLRRKLMPTTIAKWENEFGLAWVWLPGGDAHRADDAGEPSPSDADNTDSGPPTRLALSSTRKRRRFVRPHFVFQERHAGSIDVY